jgi:hypothetical protein
LRICYSTAQPYIELIQEIPGTIWECNEHSNIHHVGFWSDAVGNDGDRWQTTRCPLALGAWEDGEIGVAYHHDDVLGVRLELVSTSHRELIEGVMAAPPTL